MAVLNLKRKRGKPSENTSSKVRLQLSNSLKLIHHLPRKIREFEDEPDDVAVVSNDDEVQARDVDQTMKSDDDAVSALGDDAEWGGIPSTLNDHTSVEVHGHGTKPQKQPTGEELRVIKDATDLFRSSSFKLQASAIGA
jgi:U3 small nucleolar RNA-associated protein 22